MTNENHDNGGVFFVYNHVKNLRRIVHGGLWLSVNYEC